MLHIVSLIERRFPRRAGSVVRALFIASGLLLVAGIVLLASS